MHNNIQTIASLGKQLLLSAQSQDWVSVSKLHIELQEILEGMYSHEINSLSKLTREESLALEATINETKELISETLRLSKVEQDIARKKQSAQIKKTRAVNAYKNT